MSANELLEFVRVIESAETLSSKGYAQSVASTSSTDIFGSRTAENSRPRAHVPRLWEPRTGSEFLGSSWGSVKAPPSTSSGAAAATKSSSKTSSSTTPSSQVLTAREKSSPLRRSSSSSRQSSPSKSSPTKSPSKSSIKSPTKIAPALSQVKPPPPPVSDPLITMQMHNKFGRVIAKDLSPATSPLTHRKLPSGGRSQMTQTSPTKKSSSPSSVPSPTKKTEMTQTSPTKKSSSPSSVLSPTKKTESNGAASTLSSSPMSNSKAATLTTPTSPVTSPGSSKARSSLEESVDSVPSAGDNQSEDSAVGIRMNSPSGEEPRTPPQPRPRPRVTIRQSTIKIHDHSAKAAPTKSPEEMQHQPNPSTSSQRLGTMQRHVKPEGSRAVSRRPTSAPPPPKRRPAQPPKPKPEPVVDLRSYSKSFKLLGLDIPSNRQEATKLTHQDVTIQTTSPTLRTRLRERTQSISNLQDVIDSKEKMAKREYESIREPLSRAVFEEWYFRKREAEREQKTEAEARRADEEYERAREEEEKEAKSSENFKRWLAEKKRLAKRQMRIGKRREVRAEREKEEQRERIERAQREWREKKQAQRLKAKRAAEKAKKPEETEEERREREEAEKKAKERHFEEWKAKLDAAMRTKMAEEKGRRLREIEKKREDAREKKQDSEAAFKGWLAKKASLAAGAKGAKGARKVGAGRGSAAEKDRSDASRRAYEDWLDIIEQRELEEKYAEEERLVRSLWRPPWYPAGITQD